MSSYKHNYYNLVYYILSKVNYKNNGLEITY